RRRADGATAPGSRRTERAGRLLDRPAEPGDAGAPVARPPAPRGPGSRRPLRGRRAAGPARERHARPARARRGPLPRAPAPPRRLRARRPLGALPLADRRVDPPAPPRGSLPGGRLPRRAGGPQLRALGSGEPGAVAL